MWTVFSAPCRLCSSNCFQLLVLPTGSCALLSNLPVSLAALRSHGMFFSILSMPASIRFTHWLPSTSTKPYCLMDSSPLAWPYFPYYFDALSTRLILASSTSRKPSCLRGQLSLHSATVFFLRIIINSWKTMASTKRHFYGFEHSDLAYGWQGLPGVIYILQVGKEIMFTTNERNGWLYEWSCM